ncbi:transglycosylase SLT domain-containing protein [Desulfovibrio sp.]|uniref:transglycosylase SLT domain-containing protein n=1 Tax=Desulfovibrio sp. TaxID=885 RepID=UPI0025BD9206|nr:transglycosylase SLT domain-containing protein [Desulfovibrio sp.]
MGITLVATTPTRALDLSHTIWGVVGQERKIDPNLLLAVALVESKRYAGPGKISPHPWAIRDAAGPHFCKSLQEAKNLLTNPRANTDVGLMQVNLYWNGNRVKDPSDLLDPGTNIRVGADVLVEAIRSAPNDIILGIGRYHRPDDEIEARAYGTRVYSTWQNLTRLPGKGSA